jgi:predicted nucleotidyltransferase
MSTPTSTEPRTQPPPVAVLRARRAALRERFGVRRIGVFGSQVRGDATPDSDLDVLVEFEPEEATYDHLFDLHAFLRELFGQDVDVVTTDGLSPHMRPYVEHDLVWA